MVNPRQAVRAVVFGLLPLVVFLALASASYGQQLDFAISVLAPGLAPSSVDPGVPATANISVQPMNTTSAPTVNLACAVASQVAHAPTCTIASSAVAPAVIGLTVNTPSAPAGTYQITVTGSDATGSQPPLNLSLTVVAITPGYTLTVTTPLNPNSVQAGSGTSGVVTLTPVGGYVAPGPNNYIYLSCSSVTPAVIPAPQCSFNPTLPGGPPKPVSLSSGVPATSVLTITTAGPITQVRTPRLFYVAWLLPGLALAGAGSAIGRSKRLRFIGWMLLMTLAGGLLLIPACGTPSTTSPSPSTNPTNSGTTPNNTYTFTLTGADANGMAPSNTPPTVTLTVD
jgi:hypothetical protein